MKTVTISVTQGDINEGESKSSLNCPIALAIDRDTDYESLVSFLEIRLQRFSEDGLPWHRDVALPQSAVDFVHAFDRGRHVHPFSFTLEVPK